jgi:uncharacterized protein (TIGR01777 family)
MRVFMTGASGFLGRAIAAALRARGDEVVGLSRRGSGEAGIQWAAGDPSVAGAWQARVAECDAVVHLAGESIAGKRWSAAQKELLRTSRLLGTANVVAAIASAPRETRPRVLFSASGADYYPADESDRPYAEDSPAGTSFLAELCVAWEAAARAAEPHGVRVVTGRFGVVLGRGEGAMAKLATAFKAFVGGPVGSGRQWFSWVHVDDLVTAVLLALDKTALRGPINVVAPGAVRQRDFADAIGRALGRPSWLPVPGAALRLAVGELAQYLLSGRRVVPAALEHAGMTFRYPSIQEAVRASL